MKEKKEQEENLVNEIEKTKLRMSEVNEELNLIRSELQNAGRELRSFSASSFLKNI